MKVQNDVLEEMLVAQEELNGKYTADWRNDVKHEEIFTAVFTEVAEFLESSPQQWKWWKRSYLENDVQNQYIEIVDVIHFGLSYMLFNNTVEDIVRENEFTQLKSGDLFESLEMFRVDNSLENFYNLIEKMVTYSPDLKSEELVRIYFEKLAINHKRVAGGYTEGTYQKHDEDGQEDNRVIEV